MDQKVNETAIREKIRRFRDIGERFIFHGVELTVTCHGDVLRVSDGLEAKPSLTAEYLNKKGEIISIRFDSKHLDRLIAESRRLD